jgi:predicted Zn-dependent peptidase
VNKDHDKREKKGNEKQEHKKKMMRNVQRFYGVAAAGKAAEVTVLPNGLKVLSVDNGGPLASLGVVLAAGARHEKCNSLGASHVLSRLASFSTFNRSSVRLTNDLENVHSFQVQRGREATSFSCQVLREEVPSAASLLLDIARPRVLEYEIRDVADAVVADTEEALSSPDLFLEDEVHSTAFRAVGLGRSLYARSASLTQEQLIGYLFSNWRAEFATVVGVNVPHQQLVDAAGASGNFKDHVEGFVTPRTLKASEYRGGESRKYSSDAVHFSLGFRGLSHAEGGKDVQAVLVRLLSKRLGGQWRASSFSYSDAGLITLSSSSSAASATASQIESAANALKGASFSQGEVEAAKKAVSAQWGVCLQSSPAALLKTLVFGGANVSAVTADQVCYAFTLFSN